MSSLPALLTSMMSGATAALSATESPEAVATADNEGNVISLGTVSVPLPSEPVVLDAPSTDADTPNPPFTVTTGTAPSVDLNTFLPPPAADISRIADQALEVASMNETRPAPSFLSTPSEPERTFVSAARRWIIIGLALTSVVEAGVIAVLATRRPAAPAAAAAAAPLAVTIDAAPGSTVFVDERPAGTTPLKLSLNDTMRSIRIAGDAPPLAGGPAGTPGAAATAQGSNAVAAALAQAAARPRSGGIRFTTPIELQVLEGNRVLGRTADGPIVISPGTHQLDLINAELGFRTRQFVDIKAGEIASFTVTTPMGRLSLNAQPWAQVWVDENAVGETPIANLSVPIGQHEITFRHPQLVERKETVVVRADGVTRLSATFGR